MEKFFGEVILAFGVIIILGITAYVLINEGSGIRTLPHRLKHKARKMFRRHR